MPRKGVYAHSQLWRSGSVEHFGEKSTNDGC
nr:MAG TPA: hypothetical protein [Caudoviricetes sp.]